MVLHILTPASSQTPDTLLAANVAHEGDLVADFRQFPLRMYEIKAERIARDITLELLAARDYWAVAREWLTHFTQRTGLQDILAVDGYGFWWTLNSLKFVPVLSDVGNAFAWIDFLDVIHKQSPSNTVIIYGKFDPIHHLVSQIFQGATIQLQPEAKPYVGRQSHPPRKMGLIIVRILLAIIYLIYARIRHPEIVFFSGPTLLRSTSIGSKQQLRDVYLGDVAEALQSRGWRIAFIETYGWNASWRGLMTRGFFFANDLLFLLGMPSLRKLGIRGRIARKWREKWEDVLPSLGAHLRYRGYDIAPMVLPIIAREFAYYAPYFEAMTNMWRRIWSMWRPRLLYINAYYGLPVTSAIVAAKALNILTLEQQHGVIARNHMAYLVPKEMKVASEFPLCDMMLVWGDYTKRLLAEKGVYAPEQVAISGFPRLDSLIASLPPRSETLARLDIPFDAQVVLYTSNMNASGFLSDILSSVQNLPDDAKMYWIVKLHPREKTRHIWEDAIDQRELENIKVVEDEVDFYALLAACDIHASFVSTTMIEAAVLGKLNLGLSMKNFPDPVGFAEAKAFLPAEPGRLGQTAYLVLHDPVLRDRLLREQKEFAVDWCLHDGGAVQRIVRFVETNMANSNMSQEKAIGD
jgi:hypothetical protein